MNTNPGSFYGLGIAPKLLEILDASKFTVPTPIQQKAIPIAIEGKDVIGIAQTGTGKTLAFGIPMIQRLAATGGKGLVLVPTRELALQVHDALKHFIKAFNIEAAVLIGGESMHGQLQILKRNPRIIVATPGRLLDHLGQQTARLNDVRILVLDEADRMLDMGFAPQIDKILKVVPRDRQTMLFSATMPAKIVEIASRQMKLPVRTEIAPQGTTAAGISQEIYVVKKELKGKLLVKLLEQYTGPVLLFTRTKRGAHRVTQQLKKNGHNAAEIHADRSQNQRKEALQGFKSGKYRVLAATDIAARGIDVTGIELVINFDLPDDPENYVHRIGRTGRAGHEGHAISLATPEQRGDVQVIEKLIKKTIPRAKSPELPEEPFEEVSQQPVQHAPRQHHRPARGGGHGHGRAGGGHGPAQGGQQRRPSRSDRFESVLDFIRRKNS
jgi:ATP-dependent RNA helicase RhlE